MFAVSVSQPCLDAMLGFCSRGVRRSMDPRPMRLQGCKYLASTYNTGVLVSHFVTKVSLVVGSRRELPGGWLSPATLQHRVLDTS